MIFGWGCLRWRWLSLLVRLTFSLKDLLLMFRRLLLEPEEIGQRCLRFLGLMQSPVDLRELIVGLLGNVWVGVRRGYGAFEVLDRSRIISELHFSTTKVIVGVRQVLVLF